uniref:HicA toxin of toxin-antitoxin n=1 Tax=Candidatus Kentrum sp. TUN TaxID=2126343 RepID=A0A450ZPU0_9GAMM|nr:MAG: hypothetical protein BECKTUN1418D_GA0071000_10376 [Candidatus Kentron sp. TUN]
MGIGNVGPPNLCWGSFRSPQPDLPYPSRREGEHVKCKHGKTLAAIFAHPAPTNIRWHDIGALLKSLGAKIEERERVARGGCVVR